MNENKTYKTAVLDALDKAMQEVFVDHITYKSVEIGRAHV